MSVINELISDLQIRISLSKKNTVNPIYVRPFSCRPISLLYVNYTYLIVCVCVGGGGGGCLFSLKTYFTTDITEYVNKMTIFILFLLMHL